MTAPIFSWELYVNGLQITSFGEMVIRQQCSGYGTSGCLSASFDVEIYGDDAKTAESAPKNAEVKLICPDDSLMNPPLFYISTRSVDGNRITLHCFDRMMNTQQTCSITEDQFTERETEDGEKEYIINLGTVASHIASQCGFANGWSMRVSSGGYFDIELKKDDVFGYSCRQILDTISDILKGCWIDDNSMLLFVPFMQSESSSAIYSVPQHTEIINKGSAMFGAIELTDGYEIFYSSATGDRIIRGDTPYASQELADWIRSNINGRTYTAYQCEKGKAFAYIPALSYVSFGDGEKRFVNNVTLYPTGQGMFISCGCNAVTEEEFDYLNLLERSIQKTIAKNEIVGNIAITESKGLTFFRNLNK